jgi:hypothetical protein
LYTVITSAIAFKKASSKEMSAAEIEQFKIKCKAEEKKCCAKKA